MGYSNKISDKKLHYRGDFLQWQDTMPLVSCSLLARAFVINEPQLEPLDEPPNVANAANLRRRSKWTV